MLKPCLMYYTLCIFLCIVLCDLIVTVSGDQSPSIPIKTSSVNRDSVNLLEQWKLFSEHCKFLLINDGPFSKHSELACIATVLNWYSTILISMQKVRTRLKKSLFNSSLSHQK